MAKPLAGSLGHTSNGYEHLPFVDRIWETVADPRVRSALLLLDWEGEAPASTGPLPSGPSVFHSAQKCMAPHNQPVGQGWVQALTAAVVGEWTAVKAVRDAA